MELPADSRPSAETAFHPFPRPPIEMQHVIFKFAAIEWMHAENSYEKRTHHSFGTHVEVYKTKLYRIPYEDGNMNRDPARMAPNDRELAQKDVEYNALLKEKSVLPELLFVNTIARRVMYDELVGHRDAVVSERRGHLYCEDSRWFGDTSAPDFGVRIQDFRPSGLEDRVLEEYERLDESYQQFMETTGRAQKQERSKGFFILPGNENFVHPLLGACGFASVLQNWPAGEQDGFFELEVRMKDEREEYERTMQQ